MSDRKEELEYQLRRLHREKVEQTLEEIHSELKTFYEDQAETSSNRRRENIYVLFAIAMIGGFITLLPPSSITIGTPYIYGFGIVATMALLFLLIKINTAAFSSGRHRIDKISEYGFVFSLNTTVLLVASLAIVNILDIGAQTLGAVAGVSTSFILSFIYIAYTSRRQEEEVISVAHSWYDKIHSELIEDTVENIKKLDEAESETRQRDVFEIVATQFEYCSHIYDDSSKLEPISNELNDLENTSEEMIEVLQEEFEKTVEYVEDKGSDEGPLTEKREKIREEYESILDK